LGALKLVNIYSNSRAGLSKIGTVNFKSISETLLYKVAPKSLSFKIDDFLLSLNIYGDS